MGPPPANKIYRSTSMSDLRSIYGFKIGVDCVDIFVGPDKAQLRFHKNILCEKVPYFAEVFKNALSGSKEIKKAKVFEENDPVAVGGPFFQWVYEGRYDKDQDPINLVPLMDHTITELVAGFKKNLPRSDEIKFVYCHTKSDSMLRRLVAISFHFKIVASTGKDCSPALMAEMIQKCAPLLLADVVELMRNHNGRKVVHPRQLGKCEFHAHGNSAACPVQIEEDKAEKT